MNLFKSITLFFEKNFVLLVLAVSFLGYYQPEMLVWITPYIKPLLGVIMFSMGMTLRVRGLKLAFFKPKALIIGVIAQYTIMPLVAFALALLFNLPPVFAVGLILVGSCPGGTASNVMVYLSKGDVALSIAMTTISTLIAPIMIPSLMLVLAGKWVEVDFMALLVSSAQIILIPVILGLLFRTFLTKQAKSITPVIPFFAILSIMLIIAALVAINADKFDWAMLNVFYAVILHNLLGLLLGYLIALSLGLDQAKRRAITIEVGMQSSGLGAVLAIAHFGPLASIPSIIFSVWHNIAGASLANYWSSKDSKKLKAEKPELILD